jgi:uncharacterized protein
MSETRAIFHLAFPVRSLEASLAFYRSRFDVAVGRRQPLWVDIVLFGHQLTLHEQPAQVQPREQRGVRHFGAILAHHDWQSLRERLLACDPGLAAAIRECAAGTPEAHVKLLLEDPDGYLIELKAYQGADPVALARAD